MWVVEGGERARLRRGVFAPDAPTPALPPLSRLPFLLAARAAATRLSRVAPPVGCAACGGEAAAIALRRPPAPLVHAARASDRRVDAVPYSRLARMVMRGA